jgi:predicted GNAT family N-acyltransferase
MRDRAKAFKVAGLALGRCSIRGLWVASVVPMPLPKDIPAFVVRCVTWAEAEAQLRAVREAVFVREQGVPLEVEMDGLDAGCVHVVAVADDGRTVGTARLAADGKIGRMAVVGGWRGVGVGSALVDALIDIAVARGLSQVRLAAQTHAAGFYERHGFHADSEVFDEAGIPHRRMVRRLGG